MVRYVSLIGNKEERKVGLLWAGWFYILWCVAGELVLFLEGASLAETRRYKHTSTLTYVKSLPTFLLLKEFHVDQIGPLVEHHVRGEHPSSLYLLLLHI